MWLSEAAQASHKIYENTLTYVFILKFGLAPKDSPLLARLRSMPSGEDFFLFALCIDTCYCIDTTSYIDTLGDDMNRDERINQFYDILTRAECKLPLRAICDRAGVVKADWARQILKDLEHEGYIASEPVVYTNGVTGILYWIIR